MLLFSLPLSHETPAFCLRASKEVARLTGVARGKGEVETRPGGAALWLSFPCIRRRGSVEAFLASWPRDESRREIKLVGVDGKAMHDRHP